MSQSPPVPEVKKAVQPEWQDGSNEPQAKALKEQFGEKIIQSRLYSGDLTVWVDAGALEEICRRLKGEGYTYLVDIVGIHQPKNAEKPFALSYLLNHMGTNRRLRLKTEFKDGEGIPSVTAVWKTANWLEREAWDMLGIKFVGHPNLERILLWEGFNGHPLRKDFPIEGVDTGAAIYPEVFPQGGGPVKKKEKPSA